MLGAEAGRLILQMSDHFDVYAIGPGIRTFDETRQMVQDLASGLRHPIVLDADGLNSLRGHLDVIAERKFPTILTPHPGEMSRLLELGSPAEVQADRVGAARRLVTLTRAVVVLKGHGTVVTDGERVCINDTGNPGMAKGGMGDVLTGLIAGLLCQGLSPFDAARLAVFAHGLAGDLAAVEKGELSLIPEDVLELIHRVFLAIHGTGEETSAPTLSVRAVKEAVLLR
jgi:NAD(P)H-hydrate epimerase